MLSFVEFIVLAGCVAVGAGGVPVEVAGKMSVTIHVQWTNQLEQAFSWGSKSLRKYVHWALLSLSNTYMSYS